MHNWDSHLINVGILWEVECNVVGHLLCHSEQPHSEKRVKDKFSSHIMFTIIHILVIVHKYNHNNPSN